MAAVSVKRSIHYFKNENRELEPKWVAQLFLGSFWSFSYWLLLANRPFSSCIRIKESFSYQRLCTQPRFETEALGNSEMAEIFPWPYNNPRRLFESQLTRPSFPLVSKLAMWEQPRSQGSLLPVICGWCGSSFNFSQIVNKNSSLTWPTRIIPRSRSPRISSSTFVFANFWGIWVR